MFSRFQAEIRVCGKAVICHANSLKEPIGFEQKVKNEPFYQTAISDYGIFENPENLEIVDKNIIFKKSTKNCEFSKKRQDKGT